MNPIFGRYKQNQMPQGGPLGNIANMLGQFNQFRQNFRGNPEEQVNQLLQSGQMTPDQFQQLSNMAQQFQQILGNRNR